MTHSHISMYSCMMTREQAKRESLWVGAQRWVGQEALAIAIVGAGKLDAGKTSWACCLHRGGLKCLYSILGALQGLSVSQQGFHVCLRKWIMGPASRLHGAWGMLLCSGRQIWTWGGCPGIRWCHSTEYAENTYSPRAHNSSAVPGWP